MNATLAHDYKLPPELQERLARGTLAIVRENWAEKTVEFHVPSLRLEDRKGRITAYSVIWIHPDFNTQFCHYCRDQPGDLANFYVIKETSDLGNEPLEIDTVDGLVAWLDDPSLF